MKTAILIAVLVMGAMSIPHAVKADSCYKDGYETGRNGPFSQSKFASCGNDYLKGFMMGCLSVMGNHKDVCSMAEDAGQ